MAGFTERIRNVFDDHLGPGENTQETVQARGEESRAENLASVLSQEFSQKVKDRWASDLASGVDPDVARAYAAGRVDHFNSTMGHRGRIDIGGMLAEAVIAAERLRTMHQQVLRNVLEEAEREIHGERESRGMRL